MDELFELTEKYKLSNPNEENPETYYSYLGLDRCIELLKKALKENLVFSYIDAGEGVLDGGEVILIKK